MGDNKCGVDSNKEKPLPPSPDEKIVYNQKYEQKLWVWSWKT
jgi:hypothetical protein